MQLIYLTSKTYPATTADHIFVREMSKAFSQLIGKDFTLVVSNDYSNELDEISHLNLKLPIKKFVRVFFLFWIPYFVFKNKLNDRGIVFFAVDPNLLSLVIFWKKFLRLKFKVVSDWHMLFNDWRDKFIIKGSDKLVTTTDHLAKQIIAKFQIAEDRIVTSYGGVDLALFNHMNSINDLRSELGLPRDMKLICYIGFYKTMGMSKGLDTMIRAFNHIKADNIRMCFVGGKPEEIAEYKEMASKFGIDQKCIFVEKVHSDLVPKYEQAMDILVIPYPDKPHFKDYGFPMKVYEYMASGKPIVYSNLPIIKEVLGNCAIDFQPDNPEALANKIDILLGDDVLKEQLSSKALELVKNYTWQKRAQKILDFVSR